MTYFELRFFKGDGYCYRLQEFSNFASAKEIFDDAVRVSKEFHKLIAKKPHIANMIAYQIQLVERNTAMTWLTEHEVWNA